jgi:hypothetical protein
MAERGETVLNWGWGRRGRVDRGPILLKKSILILLFYIMARRQIEQIFELKKVK